MRRGPPRRRVRRRDELRRHFSRRAERGIVEDGEIFLDRAAGCVRWKARGALDTRAVAGLGRDRFASPRSQSDT